MIFLNRKENLRFWNENFVLLNLNKGMPLKNFSIQAIANGDSIQKYEMDLFYKKGYRPIMENGISLCYENEEEEGVSDLEISEILEIVFIP